jgi:hypothetical protein
MKKNEHSATPVSPDLESSSSGDHVQTVSRRRAVQGKIVKGLLIVLCVAFSITIYVLANRNTPINSEEKEILPAVNGQSLEVEVLDGAGSMRAAQYVTDILRTQGYDVVEMKKNNGELEERTIILDRSGNLDAARKLATALGVAQDKVFQKIDHNVYLDVTVVLGKDYSHLKVFQSSNERTNH